MEHNIQPLVIETIINLFGRSKFKFEFSGTGAAFFDNMISWVGIGTSIATSCLKYVKQWVKDVDKCMGIQLEKSNGDLSRLKHAYDKIEIDFDALVDVFRCGLFILESNSNSWTDIHHGHKYTIVSKEPVDVCYTQLKLVSQLLQSISLLYETGIKINQFQHLGQQMIILKLNLTKISLN